jgi:hypothetical protein
MRVRLPRLAAVATLALLTSCAQLVQYTDEIVDRRTGRSLLVTVPATVGGFAGFVIGIPADIVALPVTLSVYQFQKDEPDADPVSTLLFPSFALWRAGTLIGTPMDVLDYALLRSWRAERTINADEQNEIEYQMDLDTLPSYPVTPVYPRSS